MGHLFYSSKNVSFKKTTIVLDIIFKSLKIIKSLFDNGTLFLFQIFEKGSGN